jgi:hypothetical protein
MVYLVIKALMSGVIVMVVSEVARRNPSIGGLIASLPLVSILGIIWLWRDTNDVKQIARHSESTFWFVLPSLPMFLLLPMLLQHGTPFWVSLTACAVLTVTLYAGMVWLLPKVGITI